MPGPLRPSSSRTPCRSAQGKRTSARESRMEQASLQLTPRHRRMLRELEGGTAAQQPRREARSQRRVSRLAIVGSLFAVCALGLVWSGGAPQGTQAVTSLPMAASGSAVLTPVAFDVLPRSPADACRPATMIRAPRGLRLATVAPQCHCAKIPVDSSSSRGARRFPPDLSRGPSRERVGPRSRSPWQSASRACAFRVRREFCRTRLATRCRSLDPNHRVLDQGRSP